MKTYPLDVKEMLEADGGGFMGYYSKGHHDPEAFYEALARKFGVLAISTRSIVQAYWRMSVTGNPDWPTVMDAANGPGRGHFPVTYYDESEHWLWVNGIAPTRYDYSMLRFAEKSPLEQYGLELFSILRPELKAAALADLHKTENPV